jgi:hypothetical protein
MVRDDGFRTVVLRPEHAALLDPLCRALEGLHPVRVIVDRRKGERRTGQGTVVSERRSGQDRRQPRSDVLVF